MSTAINILMVEDSPDDAALLLAELRRAGFAPAWKRVETEADFLAELKHLPDIILSDYSLPQFSGLRAAQLTSESGLNIPFILISGTVGEDVAVEAMKCGATDYLLKDRVARLGNAVEHALEQKRLRLEREHTEAELRWKTSVLEAQLDSSIDGILVVDSRGRKVIQNQRMNELWKIPPHISEDKDDAAQVVFATNQTKNPKQFVERVKYFYNHPEAVGQDEIELLDGTIMDRYSAPVRDQMGKHYGRIWCFRDITERKRAEDALRESEEKFRQIAENINEVFWITDPAKEQMLYVSPAYERIWGRTCQSLLDSPQSWFEAIHPDDRGRVMNAVKFKQSRGEYNETYRIMHADGSVRWIHDRAYPLRNEAGAVYRIIGTAEDITENWKLEAQFHQAQKMESIGQLAGGIAHDFNNILTAIIGNISLIKLEAGDHPAIGEFLDDMQKATSRATDLVNQILAFSRQNKHERMPVELNPIVLEALKLLRASVPATIRIQTELAKTPTVLANATAIHQVVMNLGTNAWHAMREKPGTLKVEMGLVELDADFVGQHPELHPGPHVRLSVSDTGCGIDRLTMERIFDPFFTTKGVGEGTGLGLAVVHGIVKSHDAGIIVRSQPGEGTSFEMFFPVFEAEPVANPIELGAVPRGNGEHILYVDDEFALARLGKKMLERLGYFVTTRTSASEAIAAVRDHPGQFDLVITDMTMPVMDGIKLAAELLQLQPGLPIILTSGYSGRLTPEKVRELGFREMLDKPGSAMALGQAVRRALHPPASA